MNKRTELIRLASEQGQPPQVIAAILDTLDAHPDLIDLPRVMSALQRLLRVTDIGAPIRFENCDPLVWREACEWLISLRNQPLISCRLGELFWLGDRPPSKNPVLSKGVKRYGFPYAALWHAPHDTENRQDYERLIAQLLAVFQRLGSPIQWQAQRYAVFLDLRRLCEMSHLTIPPELNVWASPEVFVVNCQYFSPGESKAENAELFASITRLVRYAYGEEPRLRNGGGGSRGRLTRLKQPELTHFVAEDPRGFLLGDPDDPDQLPGHYNILTIQPPFDPNGELAPEELGPADELWVLDDEDVYERPYIADKLGSR